MIPVDQTTFGVPGGNCFSACVASLLEMPIAEVPYFMTPEDTWWERFQDWLRPFGFHALCFQTSDWTPAGGVIMSGQSPRGPHCVVGFDGEMVHDPHPSRVGIGPVENWCVLVPLDPAKARRA